LRISEFNVAEARGGLEEVQEVRQHSLAVGGVGKNENREILQTSPGQGREDRG